jgi:transposase
MTLAADASAFETAGDFASWVGVCPGSNESAEDNKSSRSPKGNSYARRILNQAAQAAVKKKGSRFQALFQRLLPRLHHKGAIWAVAHRLARLIWKILHDKVRYIEYGQKGDPKNEKRRAQKMVQTLRKLGYTITPPPAAPLPVQG